METTTTIDNGSSNKLIKHPGVMILLTGLALLLAIMLGVVYRHAVQQKKEIATLQQRWEEQANSIHSARAEEHVRVVDAFMQTNQVRWQLVYDQAKLKNSVEVRVRNPLEYHKASFVVSLLAKTEPWLNDGRKAAAQYVSVEIAFHDVAPANSAVDFVPFPAKVETHAVGFFGWILDWFRWGGLPTVEPPIDAKTMEVKIYADHAELVDLPAGADSQPKIQWAGK